MSGYRPIRALIHVLFVVAVTTIVVACGGGGSDSGSTVDTGGGASTPSTGTYRFWQNGGGSVEVAGDALFLGVVDYAGINANGAALTQLTSPSGENWLNDSYLQWLTNGSGTVSGAIPYNENIPALGGVWQINGSSSTSVYWKTAEGNQLRVLFVLVSMPIGSDDPALLDIVERFKGIYAANGINVADVAFASLSSDDTYMDETDSNGDENLDGMERLFSVSGNFGPYGDYAVIFLVRSIGDGGDILGIAGGIPGPMIQNTTASGVVINTFGGDLSSLSDQNRRIMAETVAHELGHYLGLYHPTESDGSSFDPIGDTPECHSSNPTPSSCPDGTNLMFWSSGGSIEQSTLTENQRALIRRSWYLLQ